MKLHTKIVLGLVLGALAGVAANAFAPGAAWVNWIDNNVAGPVGQVFLRMLLMTVVPLVFASLTLGVAGLGDIGKLGRLGGRTLFYFVISSGISVVIGLTLVNVIRPGAGIDLATRQHLLETYAGQAQGLGAVGTTHFGISTFVNIVPRNPVDAAARMDMLGVIFFAIVFGAALTMIPKERADPMIRVIEALGDVVIKIIDFAMKLAPYGVFGLIFVVTSQFGFDILKKLGLYVVVVVGGLLIHATIGLSTLVRVLGGMSPVKFWRKAVDSVVTAFSTSSSNATLPTNIKVAEEELGVPPKVAGFVLPLGATMNMNGTALYEGVTVLFLAQVFGVHLGLLQQLIVITMAVVTAIGAAGVPGGSLPLMMVVLGTVGVPPEAIAIILGVDRILDMCRTTLNVSGDLTAAVYVARVEGMKERGEALAAGGAG
ncbi:MAG TPA: dicarboxylate/amino acid:cation symporter [Gemmatimonadales bacterium]|nr:dicarboxylate/amino acid:cation symporter [Gemmatimonadales bacterium]